MNGAAQSRIADIIERAEPVEAGAAWPDEERMPKLLVEAANPDHTVRALRDILADAGCLYDRGVPVRVARDSIEGAAVAQIVTTDMLILCAHSVCRPYVEKTAVDGTMREAHIRLPLWAARMYLDWRGEWRLPVLNGITPAPLLQDDGRISGGEGYDPVSCLWREKLPDLVDAIPQRPNRADAVAALQLIRETFKTFCFADAATLHEPEQGNLVVDTISTPGMDESAFLCALLTAVCRPSLILAPGVLLRAAPLSGAGAGKGLLARCISLIAFGQEPHAVTGGSGAEELEKRIAAELIQGGPVLFLDNLNNTAFRSDLLASAITERPARVRLLGKSQMMPLNATALVILTGNGLTVSEDLARRFLTIELDPRMEDPEARTFRTDIKATVKARRRELLAALLTIWRWGRLAGEIPSGRTLGSFEQWCQWVRDPLLALGCKDPAERVSEAKQRDGRRQAIVELFSVWWAHHADRPVAQRDLNEAVRQAADAQGRGRQFVSAYLNRLTGTRMAGFVLTRQDPPGKWGVATYALVKTEMKGGHRGHREHREHRTEASPMAPMAPMPSVPGEMSDRSDEEGEVTGRKWRAVL